jgi:uncharacterized protein (DUF302 family)
MCPEVTMARYETRLGHTKVLSGVAHEAAIARVTEALKTEGFGVITTIDVKSTLKQKINVDFKRYTILGACNPALAHQALTADASVGLLLPCNVTVFDGDAGETVVQVVSAPAMFEIVRNPAVEPLAREVDERLRRVVERI